VFRQFANFENMSLNITSLNSGSNGNCYYIGNEEEAILIDAGISCRETEKRLKRLDLSMDKVKAIFVSHEHGDHITGIPVLAKKYRLPVYITQATRTQFNHKLDQHQLVAFRANEPISIGNLTITAFSKFHDACDPHSFMVSSPTVKVGIFTDIGVVCDQLIKYFSQCHAAFLEANYDEEMLANGGYPYHLKKRITGGLGHLSNSQALELVTRHRPAFMSHLLLAHLSKNNNHPQLVENLFRQHFKNILIVVASRYNETPVYTITGQEFYPPLEFQQKPRTLKEYQLSLF
jgi:phosphoribosyl 1,2-cyclic phosphodiesterase